VPVTPRRELDQDIEVFDGPRSVSSGRLPGRRRGSA
jgi:hypothetical protein